MTLLERLGWRRATITENYPAREFVLRALPTQSVGAEIGVHEGDFSQILLERLQPARLHLIDPWIYRTELPYQQSFYGGRQGGNQSRMDRRYRRTLRRLRSEIRSGQVTVDRMCSANAAELYDRGYFDWVYVDGDHSYHQVRQDLELFAAKIKPGGWIAGGGHRQDAWWGEGVVRAVREFEATSACQSLETSKDQFLIQLR